MSTFVVSSGADHVRIVTSENVIVNWVPDAGLAFDPPNQEHRIPVEGLDGLIMRVKRDESTGSLLVRPDARKWVYDAATAFEGGWLRISLRATPYVTIVGDRYEGKQCLHFERQTKTGEVTTYCWRPSPELFVDGASEVVHQLVESGFEDLAVVVSIIPDLEATLMGIAWSGRYLARTGGLSWNIAEGLADEQGRVCIETQPAPKALAVALRALDRSLKAAAARAAKPKAPRKSRAKSKVQVPAEEAPMVAATDGDAPTMGDELAATAESTSPEVGLDAELAAAGSPEFALTAPTSDLPPCSFADDVDPTQRSLKEEGSDIIDRASLPEHLRGLSDAELGVVQSLRVRRGIDTAPTAPGVDALFSNSASGAERETGSEAPSAESQVETDAGGAEATASVAEPAPESDQVAAMVETNAQPRGWRLWVPPIVANALDSLVARFATRESAALPSILATDPGSNALVDGQELQIRPEMSPSPASAPVADEVVAGATDVDASAPDDDDATAEEHESLPDASTVIPVTATVAVIPDEHAELVLASTRNVRTPLRIVSSRAS